MASISAIAAGDASRTYASTLSAKPSASASDAATQKYRGGTDNNNTEGNAGGVETPANHPNADLIARTVYFPKGSNPRIQGPNGTQALNDHQVIRPGDNLNFSDGAWARKTLSMLGWSAGAVGTTGIGMLIGYLISDEWVRRRLANPMGAYGGGYGVY